MRRNHCYLPFYVTRHFYLVFTYLLRVANSKRLCSFWIVKCHLNIYFDDIEAHSNWESIKIDLMHLSNLQKI